MLIHRFSVAPMMDRTDGAKKRKYNQHLSMFVVSHAVPNAVPTIFKKPVGEQFRVAAFFGWLPRRAVYCADPRN
jgi:hypothetical protein